ncbi:hypothetical protein [Marmoricola sp. RAF53]|uniref:hypothetical protein n=1 Tax=Marmoricola sp. RAF53 TaxID=3233059 RepID=UPI003F9A0522
MHFRSKLLAAGAIALTTFGVAAPALAATRSGTMTNWTDGDASSSWHDSNTTSVSTKVVFYARCKHDFDARIRKESFGPDKTVASERINCTSYDDAVVGGDYAADDYHFDVHESDVAAGMVIYPYLSGSYQITW